MEEAKGNIKVKDTIIFFVDEWRDGRRSEMDGTVQIIDKKGAHVLYLSGYRSRNDFIPWCDIVAKVDLKKPRVSIKNICYNGNFVIFKGYN